MEKKLTDAYDAIRKKYGKEVEIGIILGTGLGGLVNEIEIEKTISYNQIPHFPISTVESHFGQLIFGKIGGKAIIAMQGRFHFYEGYNMQEITFPVRVLKMLGVNTLLISNAAGGLNLSYKKGDLMILDDHINLQTANPLTGPNLDKFGPRFPDMSRPYDPMLIERAQKIAVDNNYRVHTGVYVAVTGPNLETRAEYRFLRIIGADVVGMSTVPEVIVGMHMGLRIFAISVVTDECDPDNLEAVDVAEIIKVAGEAEPRMTHIMASLIKEL